MGESVTFEDTEPKETVGYLVEYPISEVNYPIDESNAKNLNVNYENTLQITEKIFSNIQNYFCYITKQYEFSHTMLSKYTNFNVCKETKFFNEILKNLKLNDQLFLTEYTPTETCKYWHILKYHILLENGNYYSTYPYLKVHEHSKVQTVFITNGAYVKCGLSYKVFLVCDEVLEKEVSISRILLVNQNNII